MASCELELWKIIKSIEPAQKEKADAKRSQLYLRKILATGQMENRIIDSYLSGSYSRDTAIRPLDDVDIIFVIDPSKWERPFLASYPDPEKVLNSFANAIRYRYPVSSVYGQRRSVCLELYHLYIDVVPAINLNDNFILIPDKESDEWIKSSPKIHSENATKVNKYQNGKFKPLVKLLKLWNSNLPSTAKFKSFTIETMMVRLFQRVKFQTMEEGLFQFFDFVGYLSGHSTYMRWESSYGISFFLGCEIPDAAGTGSNTAARIDSNMKRRFVENALVSRDRLREAQKAISSQTACRRLFEALRI